jgi:hypothetical protein
MLGSTGTEELGSVGVGDSKGGWLGCLSLRASPPEAVTLEAQAAQASLQRAKPA